MQDVFKTLTYDMIGDDNATVFFQINSNSGLIQTKMSLISDRDELYRVCMEDLEYFCNVLLIKLNI